MVLFFDNNLSFIANADISSFSFNKKINKEGSGRITLLHPLPKNSFFLILFNEGEKIAEGYITDYNINGNNINISFSTFETLLKLTKTPKNWAHYEHMNIVDIMSDCLFSFNYIYKTSYLNFFNLEKNRNILKVKNVSFERINKGELILSFDPKEKKKNNFRYVTDGYIIFTFDLGDAPYIKRTSYSNFKREEDYYPIRVLRFTADMGEKTYLRVRAIESDEPFNADTFNIEDIEKKAVLPFRRDIKDFEQKTGCILPSRKRYIAIMFSFKYIHADYVQDFITHEIIDEKGEKVKRTIRGFTPVLYGFEIINRSSLFPFSNKKREDNFSNYVSNIVYFLLGKDSSLKRYTSKIKFEDSTPYDILQKIEKEAKCVFSFNLSLEADYKKCNFTFFIHPEDFIENAGLLNKDVTPFCKDKRKEKGALLYIGKDELTDYSNFNIHGIKKRFSYHTLLHLKGEGQGQNVLYLCLFTSDKIDENGNIKKEIFLYYPSFSFNEISKNGLKSLGLTEENITDTIPNNMFFNEEYIEDGTIKNAVELIKKGLTFLEEKEKKETHVFEITADVSLRVADACTIIDSKKNTFYESVIMEEKFNFKNGFLTKSFSVGDFFYNPFNLLFYKNKLTNESGIIPLQPNITKAKSKKNIFKLFFLGYGAYDGFSIEIRRLDRKPIFNGAGPIESFYTESLQWTTSILEIDVLYSVRVASTLSNKLSTYSDSLIFKLSGETKTHYMLSSLKDDGEDGDIGFFLDVEYRQNGRLEKYNKKTGAKLHKCNNVKEAFFLNKASNILKDEEKEIFEKYKSLSESEKEEAEYLFGIEYIYYANAWHERRESPQIAPFLHFEGKDRYIKEPCPDDVKDIIFKYYMYLITFATRAFKARKMTTWYKVNYYYDDYCTYYTTSQTKTRTVEKQVWGVVGYEYVELPSGKTKRVPQYGYKTETVTEEYEDITWHTEQRDSNDFPAYVNSPHNTNKEYTSYRDELIEYRDYCMQASYTYVDSGDYLHSPLGKALKEKEIKYTFLDKTGNNNNLKSNRPFFVKDNKTLNLFHVENDNLPLSEFICRSYYSKVDVNKSSQNISEVPVYKTDNLKIKDEMINLNGEHFFSFFINSILDGLQDVAYNPIRWDFSNKISIFKMEGVINIVKDIDYLIFIAEYPQYEKKEGGGFKVTYKEFVFHKEKIEVSPYDSTGDFSICQMLKDYFYKLVIIYKKEKVIVSSKESFEGEDYKISFEIYKGCNKISLSEGEGDEGVYFREPFNADAQNTKITMLKYQSLWRHSLEEDIEKNQFNYAQGYKPLPYFLHTKYCMNILDIAVFDYALNKKTINYIKKHGLEYEIKKSELPEGNNNLEKDLKPTYQGIVMDELNKTDNEVITLKNRIIRIRNNDYILVGKKQIGFKAGTLYRWLEGYNSWEPLLPFSKYPNEYITALKDIEKLSTEDVEESFFKDFIAGTFALFSNMFTFNLQVNSLDVRGDANINNLICDNLTVLKKSNFN